MHCPVVGFTYSTGFGPLPGGGFHYGVDMGAPEGTPVYAVRNGTLWYWSTGDIGGYSVYLKADDGNTYYYTHLTAYDPTLENTQHDGDGRRRDRVGEPHRQRERLQPPALRGAAGRTQRHEGRPAADPRRRGLQVSRADYCTGRAWSVPSIGGVPPHGS